MSATLAGRLTSASRHLLPFVVVALSLALYGRTLGGFFQADDFGYIQQIADWGEKEGLTHGLAEIWRRGRPTGTNAYRPLAVSLFTLEYSLFGTRATCWRFVHLSLHMASALLLGLLARRLVDGGPPRRGAMIGTVAASLFILQPASPEVVAWIATGGDVLALLFTLLMAHCYLQSKGRQDCWYAASLVCCALALAAKETGLIALALLIGLHAAALVEDPKGRSCGRWALVVEAGRRLSPCLVILLGYLALRWQIFGDPFAVTSGTPQARPLEAAWWQGRMALLWQMLAPPVVAESRLEPSIRWISAALFCSVLARALVDPALRRLLLVGGIWGISATALLLPHLYLRGWAEGSRGFYMIGAAFSLCLSASALPSRLRVANAGIWSTIFLLAMLMFVQQQRILEPWVIAGRSMRSLPAEIARVAATLRDRNVLLTPDRIRGAYFAQNAQGSIVSPPIQERRQSDKVVLVIPRSVKKFFEAQPVPRPSWCWNVRESRYRYLGEISSAVPDWLPRLQRTLRDAGCRDFLASFRSLPRPLRE